MKNVCTTQWKVAWLTLSVGSSSIWHFGLKYTTHPIYSVPVLINAPPLWLSIVPFCHYPIGSISVLTLLPLWLPQVSSCHYPIWPSTCLLCDCMMSVYVMVWSDFSSCVFLQREAIEHTSALSVCRLRLRCVFPPWLLSLEGPLISSSGILNTSIEKESHPHSVYRWYLPCVDVSSFVSRSVTVQYDMLCAWCHHRVKGDQT